MHVSYGVGYWLHPRLNQELQTGAVVLLSDQIRGCVRASQVGELRLQFFRTDPRRLTGLASMADQTICMVSGLSALQPHTALSIVYVGSIGTSA